MWYNEGTVNVKPPVSKQRAMYRKEILMSSDIISQNDKSNQPLPLNIAERWAFELTYYINDHVYLYSIKDWLTGLGISTKQGRINMMNRVGGEVQLYPLTIETMGGNQTTDFTNDEGLYRLAQEMRSTKKRPQLKEIKAYLAKAGVLIDRIKRSSKPNQLSSSMKRHMNKQAFTENYQQQRIDYTNEVKLLNPEFFRTIQGHPKFGILHNLFYKELTGMTKNEIIADYEHTAKTGVDALGADCVYALKMVIKNVRLHLSKYEDDYILNGEQERTMQELIRKYASPLVEALGMTAELEGTSIHRLGDNSRKKRLL